MNLTDIRVIKEIERKFDFGFSKGLGQNFLLDETVLSDIVSAAEIDSGVLEVGPGFGVLTNELLKNAQKVVTIELDRRLIPVLNYTLADFDNLKIIEADVLKIDLKKVIDEEFGGKKISVAANLPYYITTPIITKLIEEKLPIKNIVVMVQKEVAERIVASPGTKDYGAISVLCQYYTEPKIVTVVPNDRFFPAPKVDSAVLCMRVLEKPKIDVADEKLFFKVVKVAFSQRRKTLLNCLASGFSIDKPTLTKLLENIGIEPNIRGERLGLSEFKKVADAIEKI